MAPKHEFVLVNNDGGYQDWEAVLIATPQVQIDMRVSIPNDEWGPLEGASISLIVGDEGDRFAYGEGHQVTISIDAARALLVANGVQVEYLPPAPCVSA